MYDGAERGIILHSYVLRALRHCEKHMYFVFGQEIIDNFLE